MCLLGNVGFLEKYCFFSVLIAFLRILELYEVNNFIIIIIIIIIINQYNILKE
jgi:hypothetical protein